MKKLNTLVIGSGAAGLASAVRLRALGVDDLAIYTEGLEMGTSINTGSDKQTYYKLGMCGAEPDSPVLMARDLAQGGAVHGDLALAEAALSPIAFAHLTALGVPFPHDAFGQYVGYKTDHDPKRRATSCGPYTSRDMCRALIAEAKRREIPIFEKRDAVKLLTDDVKSRAIGAVFLNRENGEFETVRAENVVFATGGPGGLYEASVYPKAHTGGIGLALEAGARACNLAESQFGLASVQFRWNVSGSYMQVLPRFISTDRDGGDEREFLREYFDSTAEMYDAIFLKGYQWPFAANHLPGSSLIDVFTYIETTERGRRVWLDYRTDPADFDFGALSKETRDYLERSGATADSPLKRLEILNAPAIEHYRRNAIDLALTPLEIAVCAQHNNGGLAGTIWWESVNLKRLFPVGEVNGSHGVARPGGSALNAGQVGAFRLSEYIAANNREHTFSDAEFQTIADRELAILNALRTVPATLDPSRERAALRRRMSENGAFARSVAKTTTALDGAYAQLAALYGDGLGGLNVDDLAEALRNRHLCAAQIFYLESILMQVDYIGSRGGSVVLAEDGVPIHPKLPKEWRMKAENATFRNQIMICGYDPSGRMSISWEPSREIPDANGWFETVWSDFRAGKIYEEKS